MRMIFSARRTRAEAPREHRGCPEVLGLLSLRRLRAPPFAHLSEDGGTTVSLPAYPLLPTSEGRLTPSLH